ncbi:MAG: AIM24 family protein, partial [Myxococcota bacterium]|nr:AIM24 family protein [Myxococcota bacterium]
ALEAVMQDQGEGQQALARTGEQGSVLDALEHLELDVLQRYCEDITINGVIAQTVSIKLGQGQSIWASRGSLLAYSDAIDWTLKVPGGAGKAVGRMLSGEGASLTYVTAKRPGAEVVLSANQSGKLVTWDLSRGPIVCTSGSFLAALGDVDIEVTVARSAGAALFGGAGLFMQKLSGTGIVLIHGAGDFIEKQLAPGEKLLVSTGNLAVFSADVNYNVRSVGGCLKSIFGGEGLFMTEMSGPGWVMLQSLKKLPVQAQGMAT